MWTKILTLLIAVTNSADLPNFIIFFADDMGYYDTSYAGHPTISTPNIDKLAREGMIFTQWYSGFHVCSPSRAAMLTGRICMRSGMCGASWTGGVIWHGAIGGLPTTEITFAEALKQKGYVSKMIGKWHLGQKDKFLPSNQGFDETFIIPYSVDMGSNAYMWWKSPNYTQPILSLIQNAKIIEQPVNLDTISVRYLQQATSFINNSVASNKPFVLYVPHSHVHTPIFANPQFCNSSIRGRYGDAMAEMDWLIGEIMNVVNYNNIKNNTLSFFTSDNGPWIDSAKRAAGTAGIFKLGKTTTWEGGIRMPGIAHWPEHIKSNSRSMEVVATYDIFVTILNIAGVPIPSDRYIDGRDMSNILFNNGKSLHECIYIWGGTPGYGNNVSGLPCMGYNDCPGLFALRCGDYKMHWVTMYYNTSTIIEDPPLLYNINRDPSELHPIWPNNVHYNTIRRYMEEKKLEHLQTVNLNVTNQAALGWKNANNLCAAPHSQTNLPMYPNCTLNPENWNVSNTVCLPACYAWDNCGTLGNPPPNKDWFDPYSDYAIVKKDTKHLNFKL